MRLCHKPRAGTRFFWFGFMPEHTKHARNAHSMRSGDLTYSPFFTKIHVIIMVFHTIWSYRHEPSGLSWFRHSQGAGKRLHSTRPWAEQHSRNGCPHNAVICFCIDVSVPQTGQTTTITRDIQYSGSGAAHPLRPAQEAGRKSQAMLQRKGIV